MLREAARVLADDFGKRVVVVDTSNEIAGDGDIPHPAIGKARRMQVRTPSLQHEVMIEAVENHMPQVIVIDEIGTELEAQAARTIAERGVQLIGTAHGNNLDNLMLNPTLSDLIGGIQSVTLGDEEARRRRTQKSVLERKAPPTFDVIIEIQDRERVLVHADVADTVDAMLRGDPVAPELRWRDEEGVHRSQSRPRPSPREQLGAGPLRRARRRRARRGGRSPAGAAMAATDGGFAGGSGGRFLPGRRAGGARPGFRPGASGSWRPGRSAAGGRGVIPGATPRRRRWPAAGRRPGRRAVRGRRDRRPRTAWSGAARRPPEPRARDARELARQREWREPASRAIDALKADEGTAPVNVADLEADDEAPDGSRARGRGRPRTALRSTSPRRRPLPTLRVLPQGISRKRLEQAIRELQLPVIIARDVDEADVVMTLRSEYKQKTPMLREAEERACRSTS